MPRQHEEEQEEVQLIDQQEMHPYEDFMNYVQRYTRQRPEMMALTCLGLGFILGWKLKPW